MTQNDRPEKRYFLDSILDYEAEVPIYRLHLAGKRYK